jgi:hypothetical protein
MKQQAGREMSPSVGDDIFHYLHADESTLAPEGRTLYLSRHGESEFNLYGKVGVSFIKVFIDTSVTGWKKILLTF